jgi:hypothetical protein
LSINDFENIDYPDSFDINPDIVSIMGKATNNALLAKEKLQNATSEALDASFSFGFELGAMDEHERIIKLLSEIDTEFASEAASYLIANPRKEKD